MKKNTKKTLQLSRETVRMLRRDALARAVGGLRAPDDTRFCPVVTQVRCGTQGCDPSQYCTQTCPQ